MYIVDAAGRSPVAKQAARSQIGSSDRLLGLFVVLVLCIPKFGWPVSTPARITYEVDIKGVSAAKLRSILEKQSQTVQNRKRPPASQRQLVHRAQNDVPRLQEVLQSQGYYEGKVSVTVTAERNAAAVHFTVVTGPLYRIGLWEIVYEDIPPGQAPPTLTLPTKRGRPAATEPMLAAEQNALQQLRNQGYPFCRTEGRKVTLNAKDKTIELRTNITAGPLAQFGPVSVTGVAQVDAAYVRRRIAWTPGSTFRQQALRRLEKDLLQCGLFSSVRVEPDKTLDPNGLLPIHIKVSERKHRTVRLGGSYVSDDQGFGAQSSWEHRNLFGQGQRLRAEIAASQIGTRQSARYIHPDVWQRNLDLHLDLDHQRQHPKAFDSDSLRTAATLEYQVDPWHTRLWGGIAQDVSIVEQFNVRQRYRFIEFPMGLDWDRRNDPLDAKKGWRFLAQTTPSMDARSDLRFAKHHAEGRYFQPLDEQANTVIAGRIGVGLIAGAHLMEVPANKRFYSGGAGSVRGYAYQAIGPRLNGTPLGGLSRVETSLELRHAWDDTIGSVLFLDGGMVMAQRLRRSGDESMRWGAGVGLRYSLGFAPLRVDVAFPLNRQHDERKVQFYVSIGQAF